MHAIIVGCGRVGSGVAAALTGDGHSVAVIDKNEDAFRRLPDDFSGRTHVGVGFDRAVLDDAGIRDCDAFAAVTNGDNSNIVAARVAHERFRVPRVVARIYDPRRAEIYQRLGIPTIATVAWTADQVLRRLAPDELHPDWVDPTGWLTIASRPIPDRLIGKKLQGLDRPGIYRLVGLSRFGRALVPSEEVIGQEGDTLVFSVATDDVGELEAALRGEGG